jgi:hypothetical protein
MSIVVPNKKDITDKEPSPSRPTLGWSPFTPYTFDKFCIVLNLVYVQMVGTLCGLRPAYPLYLVHHVLSIVACTDVSCKKSTAVPVISFLVQMSWQKQQNLVNS